MEKIERRIREAAKLFGLEVLGIELRVTGEALKVLVNIRRVRGISIDISRFGDTADFWLRTIMQDISRRAN